MKRKIYIILFSILYISVGLVSTIHAVQLFNLANNYILSIILAITFEIGQAVVLFSILTSPKTHSKIMPWILMFILTLVQVLGNVFSSYKYLMLNSTNNLKYFKEPIFIWTELPDNITTVIITYIIGAILPIVALCMTGMLNNFLENENTNETINNNSTDEEIENNDNNNSIEENIIEEPKEEQIEKTIEEPKEIKEVKKKSHFVNI